MRKICSTLLLLFIINLAFGQFKKPIHQHAKSYSALKASIKAGEAVYTQNCLTCHQADGGGVQNMNPPLIKTSYVLGDKGRIIGIVLNGFQHEDIDGDSFQNVMPSFNYLTDKQIADVLTYVRNSFGNKAGRVMASEVKISRTKK